MSEITDLSLEETKLISRIRRLRRFREVDAPSVCVEMEMDLIARVLRELLGENWTDGALAVHQRDLACAAGECMVPVPEPGGDLAKVVRANALLRLRIQNIFDRVDYLFLPSDDEVMEGSFPTIPEKVQDQLYCRRARNFVVRED